VLVESVEMGVSHLSMGHVEGIIDTMREEYMGRGYHLLLRNCNHFSADLCDRLLGRPLPNYINRLAFVGGCATMCVPPQYLSWLGKAPVNSPRASGGGGLESTRGTEAANRGFSGHGNRLGDTAVTGYS